MDIAILIGGIDNRGDRWSEFRFIAEYFQVFSHCDTRSRHGLRGTLKIIFVGAQKIHYFAESLNTMVILQFPKVPSHPSEHLQVGEHQEREKW